MPTDGRKVKEWTKLTDESKIKRQSKKVRKAKKYTHTHTHTYICKYIRAYMALREEAGPAKPFNAILSSHLHCPFLFD